MKIEKITQYTVRKNINFKNQIPDKNTLPSMANEHKKDNDCFYYVAGAIALASVGLCCLNRKKANDNPFLKSLAEGVSEYLKKPIKAESLKSVMTKDEFLSEISSLKQENFVPSKHNIENGIFCADLHSHTSCSDGKGSVSDILDGVVGYANKLYAKTKKKFLFAITDHNGVEGVKEALGIIAQSPDKFKNVRFVTGTEISFIQKCEPGSLKHNRFHNPTECAELLVYGFNPFSKNVNSYFSNLYAKRNNLCQTAFNQLNSSVKDLNLSTKEAKEYALFGENNQCMFNSHWLVNNYAQIKARSVALAKEQKKTPEFFLSMCKENKILNPYQFDDCLKAKHYQTQTQKINPDIDKICKTYFPRVENDKIINLEEYEYKDVIHTFSQEPDVIIGFAHPAFLFENIHADNMKNKLSYLVQNSQGMLQLSEKYHQGYSLALNKGEMTQEFIDKTNTLIDEFGLKPIGGRDNHQSSFL